MIPLHDDNPTRRVPWVTLALIVANAAIFLLEIRATPQELTTLISRYGFTPLDFLAAPFARGTITTILSSMFLHAGWIHIAGNMLYLWIFGNNIEDRIGPLRFMAFYLLSGSVATLTQALAAPASALPVVGASGAVAGVLGAYLLLYPRAKVVTLIPIFFYLEVAALPAAFVIGFWFLLQLAQGVGTLGTTAAGGGVAWWAHVGGFVAGCLLILPASLADLRRARTRRGGR